MEVKPSQLPTQQSTSIPTTSADNTASNEFKVRYYNPNDIFFDKEKYPIEITDVQDSSLTQMSCTSNYTGYGKDYTSYDESTRKSNPLTDKTLLSDIQMLNKQYNGKTVSEILACVPQQGKRIVLYSLGPCGGGCSGIPYVGVEDSTGIHQVSQIQNNMAYFGCRQPLQLTKTNNFYFKCGGGDGPGASASIYNLSLNNLTVTKVKECTAGIDEAGKQYSKCE